MTPVIASPRSRPLAPPPPRPWSLAAVLLTLALVAAAGCAVAPDSGPHPAWPPPPATARIVHRQSLRGIDDLAPPSALDRLGGLLAGDRPRIMLRPHAVAVLSRPGSRDRLLVTDQELQGVHVLALGGREHRFLSRAGDAYFVSPVGVAGCDDLIAVSDSALLRVVLLTPEGKLVRDLVKPGGFLRPTGLAFDPQRREVLVVDTGAHEVCVFDLEGNLRRRFGENGLQPGAFNFPTHVWVDRESTVYVTDSLNFRIQGFDWAGRFRFALGRQGDASGHLGIPKGVAVDSDGHIYVVDSYFGNVQIFDRQGALLLAVGGLGSGPGQFQLPTGLFIDRQDRLFVCDSHNRRVQVFQYLRSPDHDPSTKPTAAP